LTGEGDEKMRLELVSKNLAGLVLLCLGLSLPACASANIPLPTSQAATETILPVFIRAATESAVPSNQDAPEVGAAAATGPLLTQAPTENSQIGPDNPSGGITVTSITISVGNDSFSAKLYDYDNETTRPLLAKFPLNQYV
jgi:hypothetical protein